MVDTLDEMTLVAAGADGPSFPPPNKIKIGGVDPLGLRQINFDLMDTVLFGINNVARHIRPFVVVAWAWRRAAILAESGGQHTIRVETLRDFVDRIEVVYAWSQFLRKPDADLPGRDVLAGIMNSSQYEFGGKDWDRRKKVRRYSTALSSPINYGPALKSLRWIEPNPKDGEIFVPCDGARPAIDAFEALIVDRLEHPVFSKLGRVIVTAAEVAKWANSWALESPTKAEKQYAWAMLAGSDAPVSRRLGIQLAVEAVRHVGRRDVEAVRKAMVGRPSNFLPTAALVPTSAAWRRTQIRQLFRLALEAGLYWLTNELRNGSQQSAYLVKRFIDQCEMRSHDDNAGRWLATRIVDGKGPIELMSAIETALAESTHLQLARAIADAISFSISQAPPSSEIFENSDRLPLARAKEQAIAFSDGPIADLVQHILETWILAQHVYWSVGRGLADARSGGKMLLRLRIVLEEGGWTLSPGVMANRPPNPTPDRLQTALSLAAECGELQ
jgi:hypothetical protein